MFRRSAMVGVLACVAVSLPASGQDAPTLTPSDYGQFESLGAFKLDPTGHWLVADIRRVDETRELRLRRADGSGDAIVLEHATSPEFSSDGRWMAYRKGVSPDEREAAEDPIRDRLGLVELGTGHDSVYFDVQSFAFRDDGGWLAVRGYAAADSVGADLVVMDPASGAQTLIGNVDEFAWQDEGILLAATLRTAWGSANGVVLHDPNAGTLRTIDTKDARYRSLTWQDESSRLAVLRSVSADDAEDDSHDIVVWEDVSVRRQPKVMSATGRGDVPHDRRVTEYSGISFSDDGQTIFVGVRPWEHDEEADEDGDDDGEEARSDDDDQGAQGGDTDAGGEEGDSIASDQDDDIEPADVQVWHWEDDQIIRAQESGAGRISRQTMLAAWDIGADHFMILGTDLDEPVRVIEGGRWGLVPDYTPYMFERRFGDRVADWYRVDIGTGERVRLVEAARAGVDAGANDGTVQLFHETHWSSIDLESLEWTALGDPSDVRFERSLFDYDYPGPRPSWGVGAWSEDGSTAFLYDKHDVWRADLNSGSVERVTAGAESGLQYRVLRMDPTLGFRDANVLEEDEAIWLSVRSLETKASGFARLRGNGDIERLVWEDARVGSLTRADEADRFAYRQERWGDSPDVFVTDGDLGDARQVTRTNPFQDDFAWGRSELVSYTTDAGHDLQAILVYPADFEPGRKYPLILYQYERLSDGLHRYYTPSERSYYNYQVWSQEGYFVLMPDIVYEPGRPGPSALDAVEHALDAAVATGHVDPDRMGLIGHSWGGYQAAYLPTRTNRFAASVAGAAITNFLSFMGAVHWNGGLPELGHWETGQARMASPFWDDLEGHLESSPANFIQDLETPVLLMHGDADGVVDFRQGLEYYNYARRAGKEVVLLVYPGADHGLRQEAQQVDYHRRILQWFGHYLKGEEAASWITDGESWVEREKRIGS